MAWDNLGNYFSEQERKFGKEKPDILIVPGSSIPYAGAWDKNPHKSNVKAREQSIKSALNNFKESIHPGGVLILTTTPDKSFARMRKNGIEVDEYTTDFEGYGKVRVREEITHEPKTRTRKWRSVLIFADGQTQTIERNAFMLPRSELMKMLKGSGFINIKKIDVPGEKGHYDGIIAELPANH
tara:strand:- start:9690 stop:10238 length:549 start_codon:yes stop_codon:yes gene_type:complete